MSKTYTPRPEADAIIAREVAKGNFETAEEAEPAGVELLEAHEVELKELRKLIDEGDAAIAAGQVHRYGSAEELLEDIVARGNARSKSA